MADPLETMLDKFSPDTLGLDSVGALTERLERYLLDAVTRVDAITPALTAPERERAIMSWAKFRAYDDAYDHWLTAPIDTELDAEGSVGMGDRRAILTGLAAARDRALGEFEDVTGVEIPVAPITKATITASTPLEVTW